jgi:hypothetical protein
MTTYGIKLKKPPRFQDVPQFTRDSPYAVDIPWSYLKDHLARHAGEDKLDLDPDFQRGHVWTPEKRVTYIEFVLRGGKSSRDLYFNCPGFSHGRLGNYVLVDGKQRLTAAVDFLDDKIEVFGGWVYSDFTDGLTMTGPSFRWHVNDLKTRAEVLQWYLDLNTGGVVHTDEEINKVKRLLAKELKR